MLFCPCKTNSKLCMYQEEYIQYIHELAPARQQIYVNVQVLNIVFKERRSYANSKQISTNLINVKANMEFGGQVPVSLVRFLNERHEEIWRAFIFGVFNRLLKSHTELGISWKTVYKRKKKEKYLNLISKLSCH